MKKLKQVPKFKNDHEEDDFWQKADASEYFDLSKMQRLSFPNLKLTSKPITIRLPVAWVDQIKVKANALDIPYQALIKQYIAKGMQAA